MRCSLTGAILETCCCVERQGGLHCTLVDEDVESCCCHPVPVTACGSEEGAADRPAAAKTLA